MGPVHLARLSLDALLNLHGHRHYDIIENRLYYNFGDTSCVLVFLATILALANKFARCWPTQVAAGQVVGINLLDVIAAIYRDRPRLCTCTKAAAAAPNTALRHLQPLSSTAINLCRHCALHAFR